MIRYRRFHSELKSFGLCNANPVGLIQTCLENVHLMGLPWWASIACCTIALRTICFPISLRIQRNAAKVSIVKPKLDDLSFKMREAKAHNDLVEVKRTTMEIQKLAKDHDLNPLKILFMPFVQAPLMISFFLAIKGISQAKVPSFMEGGLFWFLDLSVQDPLMILPCLSAFSFIMVMESGAETGTSAINANMRNIMRFIGLGMIPVTCSFPSGVFMYWLTTNLFSLIQTKVLTQGFVRLKLGLPEIQKKTLNFREQKVTLMDCFKI